MRVSIIVEGKHDRSKLQQVLTDDVHIVCTFGTPGTKQLQSIAHELRHDEVFVFTDNDSSGRRIRGMLRELFPDAVHIYTKRGYNGVEGTPLDYLALQLEKAGLEEFVIFPVDPASTWQKDEF
ncbi:toprim domain-containing protein [Paenibacillus septentrionalis]|uniref:Toprim domain-containing protein n=1 Tax=Paenibacillus septentrionalis TaxID=429342 RepID=A0ABW1VB91_9BACL